MELTAQDLAAIWLTLKLSTVVVVLLLVIGTPIAWWLSQTTAKIKPFVSAIVALPLVLPPSVLGFYLLLLMGREGPVGMLTQSLGIGLLPFSFWGLVIGSFIFSMPFVIQPIQNAMEAFGKRPLEVAATLGASPIDRFFSVALPLAKPGIVTAVVLGFAHTLGEFGLVLMIGGNIPGATQTISLLIYDHVETLQYDRAQALSLLMIGFSFVVLVLLYTLNPNSRVSALSPARAPRSKS